MYNKVRAHYKSSTRKAVMNSVWRNWKEQYANWPSQDEQEFNGWGKCLKWPRPIKQPCHLQGTTNNVMLKEKEEEEGMERKRRKRRGGEGG